MLFVDPSHLTRGWGLPRSKKKSESCAHVITLITIAGLFTTDPIENFSHKRTERSHPLPFLVKEEELSGDELEEFVRSCYSSGVKYVADQNFHQQDDNDMFPMDGALKEPTIWRVKCMVCD
jgi:hypothetical protein